MANIPVISVVDDDEMVRGAVKDLVRSLGYVATAYSSAEEYLQSDGLRNTSCLITDVQMRGMSGADLQEHLIAKGNMTPVIFITAFANEKTRTRVLEAGAFGYLQKPFDNDALIKCLETALKTRRHM